MNGTKPGRMRAHVSTTLLVLLCLTLAACGASTPAASTAASTAASAAVPSQASAAASTAAASTAANTAASAEASTAASVEASTAASTAAASTAAASTGALPAAQGTFTYWGGLIFSDAANNLMVERVKQWGQERGVPVEVVMINQNETTQRVSAATEAGNLPDALDIGRDLMLLLGQSGQLEGLDDLYASVGSAHGGWMDATNAATNPADFGGKIYGIPYGNGGNILFRRTDVLEPAGFTEAPKTWQELGEQALKAQKPPENYGTGFALSNVGDANLTTSMLQSWGGRIADDAGKQCTIDSAETRDFLNWITGLYKQGTFPPGATTWDGAGDNTAYQSGQALFIANTGSVYINLKDNDPELATATQFSALPEGPKMRISPATPVYRAIPSTSKNKELARDLLAYLSDDAFMEQYFNAAIYGPVLQNQQSFAVFKDDPVHQGLLELALNGTAPGYPDKNNAAFAEYQTNFLTPKMIQRIVVDNLTVDAAIAETQAACQAIYDKYK